MAQRFDPNEFVTAAYTAAVEIFEQVRDLRPRRKLGLGWRAPPGALAIPPGKSDLNRRRFTAIVRNCIAQALYTRVLEEELRGASRVAATRRKPAPWLRPGTVSQALFLHALFAARIGVEAASEVFPGEAGSWRPSRAQDVKHALSSPIGRVSLSTIARRMDVPRSTLYRINGALHAAKRRAVS
jgi:hypothetical protein